MNRTERKKLLIAQGAVHRVEACLAKQVVRDGLQPRTLAAGMLRRIANLAFASPAAADAPSTAGTALLRLLPLAASMLSRTKPGFRTLLRGAVIAAAVSGAVAAIARYRNKMRSQPDETG